MGLREFGEFVRRRREALGYSQRTLGERAGRDQQWVSRIESGRDYLPDPTELAQLARALEVDVTDLLRAAGYLRDQPVKRELNPADHLAVFLRVVDERADLTPRDKETIRLLLTTAKRLAGVDP